MKGRLAGIMAALFSLFGWGGMRIPPLLQGGGKKDRPSRPSWRDRILAAPTPSMAGREYERARGVCRFASRGTLTKWRRAVDFQRGARSRP